MKQSKDIFIIRYNCSDDLFVCLFCYVKVSLMLFHYYESMILVNVFFDLLTLQVFSCSGSFSSHMQIPVFWSLLLFSCQDKLTSAQGWVFLVVVCWWFLLFVCLFVVFSMQRLNITCINIYVRHILIYQYMECHAVEETREL